MILCSLLVNLVHPRGALSARKGAAAPAETLPGLRPTDWISRQASLCIEAGGIPGSSWLIRSARVPSSSFNAVGLGFLPRMAWSLYFLRVPGPAGRPDRGQSPRQHPAACRHTVGPSPMIDGG